MAKSNNVIKAALIKNPQVCGTYQDVIRDYGLEVIFLKSLVGKAKAQGGGWITLKNKEGYPLHISSTGQCYTPIVGHSSNIYEAARALAIEMNTRRYR